VRAAQRGGELAVDDLLAVREARAAQAVPRHRAILLSRDVEGRDEQQAARLLIVPVGTARSRLARR
jgi:DNA-directed RNA polymerase specialized sigma24 family protein